tara:strand:+ start:740 stop:931 length:192 start_codon:yes stop_codon:yes gene_type:complete
MGKTQKISRGLTINLSTIPSYEESKTKYNKVMAPRYYKKNQISLTKQFEKILKLNRSKLTRSK